MDELSKLLNQVSEILSKEKTQKEEEKKRGECFNIFKVLNLQKSEVRLHSAFIAELLNPKGNHGLNDKFLRAFINDVIKKKISFDIDSTSAEVIKEYYIGPISQDYTEGGRIDLLIQDKDKQTIIIENKIEADDQRNQLLRYYNYASTHEKKYVILYLTLEGKPCKDPIDSFDYLCISYKTDILIWLEHCLQISTQHPLIRETIQQYIINLKDILSIMNDMNNELLQFLTSKENVSSTLTILKHSGDIAVNIRRNFVEQIKKNCEYRGYCCEYDEGILNCEDNKWINIKDESYRNVFFRIGVYKHNSYGGFLMELKKLDTYEIKGPVIIDLWNSTEEPRSLDPHPQNTISWTYLWSKTGECDSGKWWDWNNWNTLNDMANGEMLKYISNILDKIKTDKIFETINERLTKVEE
ncbi:MAG: PD-(D/E)XK nuclease family protein [Paludibacteraceae bacterium]|nr:PD-(D/E)XK nuclease family protein [Paludibacteraceae bacterium]